MGITRRKQTKVSKADIVQIERMNRANTRKQLEAYAKRKGLTQKELNGMPKSMISGWIVTHCQ